MKFCNSRRVLATLISFSFTSNFSQAAVDVSNSTGIEFALANTWNLQDVIGNPPFGAELGGMFFSDDGNDLFIVKNAEALYGSDASLIRLPVLRHNETNKLIGLDGTYEIITGDYSVTLDLMRKISTDNILYSSFQSGKFSRASYDETTKNFTTFQNIELLNAFGWGCFSDSTCEDTGVYGFSFHKKIKDPNDPNREMLMITGSNGIWLVPFIENALTGAYEFGGDAGVATNFVHLESSQYPGDMITIPSGSLQGDLMIIDFYKGGPQVIEIDDETGYPIDSTTNQPTLGTKSPKVTSFAKFPDDALPWGMIFDPLTNDIVISSYDPGTAFLFHFTGFPPGVDIAYITALIQQQINDALAAVATRREVRRLRNKAPKAKGNKKFENCGIAPAPCGCQLCETTPGQCNLVTVKDKRKDKCINSTMIEDKFEGYGDSCDLDYCKMVSVENTPVEKEIGTADEIATEILNNPDAITSVITDIFSNPSTAGVINGDTEGGGYDAFIANMDKVSGALDLVAAAVSGNSAAVAKIADAKRLLDLLKNIGEQKVV